MRDACFNICPRRGQASTCPNPNPYSNVCWYCDPKTDYPAPPSDDDEPITREWAIEEFGSIRWGSESYAVVINDAMTVWLTPTQDVVLVVGDGAGPPWDEPLRHIRTRGDLRRLLAALGYRREEHGD